MNELKTARRKHRIKRTWVKKISSKWVKKERNREKRNWDRKKPSISLLKCVIASFLPLAFLTVIENAFVIAQASAWAFWFQPVFLLTRDQPALTIGKLSFSCIYFLRSTFIISRKTGKFFFTPVFIKSKVFNKIYRSGI